MVVGAGAVSCGAADEAGRGAFGTGDQSSDWVGAGYGGQTVGGVDAASLFVGAGGVDRGPFKDRIYGHLATALCVRACLAGQRVQFATATEWVAKLPDAKANWRPS